MISGDNQVKSTCELYMKSKLCLAEGGFSLPKWRPSSPKLMAMKGPELIEAKPFVEDETSITKTTLGDTSETKQAHHKVLGLTWNFLKDEFFLDFEKLIFVAETLACTKQNLLRLTAMFPNSVGLISPVIIEMKIG